MRAFGIVVALLCMGTIVTPTMDSPQAFRKSLFNDGAFANDPFAAHRGAPVSGGSTVTFDYNPDGAAIASGPSNITDALTVNGTAMTIVASYDARNAGATWAASGGAGGTLTRTGSSGALADVPFTETAARAYDNASNDYFTGTSTALIDTEDVAIEFLYHFDGAAMTGAMIGQMVGGIAKGWAVTMGSGSSGLFIFASQNGAVQATVNSSTGLGTPGWRHVMMFWDRSETSGTNGVKFYIDGASDGSGGFINHASVAGTDPLLLMRGGFGAVSNFDGKLGFVRAWKCSACMAGGAANPTQWLAIDQQRFSQLTGTYPTLALGTATPSTVTRATIGSVDIDRDGDGIRRSFVVGANWIGIARRKELTGGNYVTGPLYEPARTNLILQNQTLGTTWTPAGGAISNNTQADSYGNTILDSYESTDAAGDIAHCDDQAVTLTSATYTASATYYRTQAAGFALVEDSTIANGKAWFNLSTCATATKQAGVLESWAEPMSSTLCRVSMSFTGTVAAHTIRLCGATADNVDTYDDGTNATVDWTAGNVQVELGSSATSPITTTTATVTRNVVALSYAANNQPAAQPVSVLARVLIPNHDPSSTNQQNLVSWGTSTANFLGITSDGTSDLAMCSVYDATSLTAQISPAGDVSNGERHDLICAAATNAIDAYTDGVAGTQDTSASIAALRSVVVNVGGTSVFSGNQPFVLGRLRINSAKVTQ